MQEVEAGIAGRTVPLDTLHAVAGVVICCSGVWVRDLRVGLVEGETMTAGQHPLESC